MRSRDVHVPAAHVGIDRVVEIPVERYVTARDIELEHPGRHIGSLDLARRDAEAHLVAGQPVNCVVARCDVQLEEAEPFRDAAWHLHVKMLGAEVRATREVSHRGVFDGQGAVLASPAQGKVTRACARLGKDDLATRFGVIAHRHARRARRPGDGYVAHISTCDRARSGLLRRDTCVVLERDGRTKRGRAPVRAADDTAT